MAQCITPYRQMVQERSQAATPMIAPIRQIQPRPHIRPVQEQTEARTLEEAWIRFILRRRHRARL